MLSSLAFRFNDGSSLVVEGLTPSMLKTPDCGLDVAGSWGLLGGLGLLSVEGGVGLGIPSGLIFRGSTPSGGDMSKILLLAGNCFWSSARKSSSGSAEKVAGCWGRSQKLSTLRKDSIAVNYEEKVGYLVVFLVCRGRRIRWHSRPRELARSVA